MSHPFYFFSSIVLFISTIVLYSKYTNCKQDLEQKLKQIEKENSELTRKIAAHRSNVSNMLASHIESMPWLSGMMADFLTYDLEVEAMKLDWGSNVQREKKVASIREIRAETKRRIEEAKVAVYQLEYLKQLYPAIEDVLEADFSELEMNGEIPDYDPVRKYLEKNEWQNLTPTERNQLALDRYVESRKKSKWQIGRDYELSVAYELSQKGFSVDTHGSYAGLEDMGRDLIAQKNHKTYIIQCKYWAQEKTIHEKHVFQLFGSVVSYCMENNLPTDSVQGIFITNIKLSQTAIRVAQHLGITVVQDHPMADFPRIKCNIGRDEYGSTYIYHLPMDDQYDLTKIKHRGEFYAFTVAEAEKKGFRRAYKWHGNK